jgi:hypothetical protein
MPFGMLDTQYIDLPANIDTTYLEGLRTRSGYDFQQLLRELDRRLAALNRNIDPLIAAILAPPTTDDVADTTMPTAFVVTERGEYTIARPQYTEGQAHMLAMRGYDVTLGFTEDGLEDMSLSRILTNVDSLFLGMRLLYRKECLKRFFSDAEIRISVKTTATSPGFAGSGTGGNAFTGNYPDGQPLEVGYTHYFRDTAANRLAIIKSAKQRLEKWVTGPFDLIAPQAQIDALAALGEPFFYRPDSRFVRQGANASSAVVDPDIYAGILDENIRVRLPITDFSSPNIALFKTFGNLADRNPLVWKYDEKKGRNAYVRSRSMFPLSDAVLLQTFGINVNNRIAAALIRIDAAGGYVPPTFP